MLKKSLFIIISLFILTGCFDNIAPEDREFVITMGIDISEDQNYSISLEFPKVHALNSKSAEGDNKNVKTSTGSTLSDAMKSTEKHSSKKTYYEHMKVIVFSKEVIENEELFKSAVFELLENRAISNKILILSTTSKSEDILKENPKEDSMVGLFVANYYKKNKANIYKCDLDKLVNDITRNNEIIIPRIELVDEELKIIR